MVAEEGSFIALGALAGAAAILAAYSVNVAWFGRRSVARLDGEPGTVLLGRFPIEAFHWAARGAGKILARTGITPDALTLLSLALTVLTVPLAASGRLEAAGMLLLFGSAFDALDGIVARERGTASDAGEMLDATADRYADAFALFGLALFYRDSVWKLGIVLVALTGSMMVSYVRAKAEALGLSMPPGLMRRPERIAYLWAALTLGPTLSSWLVPSDPSRPIVLAVITLVGILSHTSALRSLLEARARLRRRSTGED